MGGFPKEIWGVIVGRRKWILCKKKKRVAHYAYLSERCSGRNRCTHCHTHSPSKSGTENFSMRVLEGPLQIIKTSVIQECF